MSKGILSTANIKGKSYFNSFANDEFPVVEQVSDTKQIGHGDGYVSDGIVPATSEIDELKLMGNTVQNLVPSEPTPTEVFTQYEEAAFVQTSSDTNIKMGNGELKQALVEGNTYKNLANRLSNRTNEVTITSSGNLNTLLQEELDQYTEILEDEPFKNAILEGKTLVNIAKSTTNEVTLAPVGARYIECNPLFKQQTKYTVIFNCTKLNDGNIEFRMALDNTAKGVDFIVNITSGINKFTFSTGSNDINRIRIKNTHKNTMDVSFKEVIILEGDYTSFNIPYFEGMKSVEYTGTAETPSTVLKTVGKNLMSSEMEIGNFMSDTGLPVDNSTTWQRTVNFIALKNNTQYQLNETKDFGKWFFFYDKDKNFINSIFARNGQFTTPNNCIYLKFSIETNDLNYKWQIEEGSTITSYEPYKESLVTTPNTLALRNVNGVKDTLNLNTGVLTRRTRETILDGNKIISSDGTLLYILTNDIVTNNVSISDKLKNLNVNSLFIDGSEGICVQNRGTNSRIYIKINGITTAAELKEYLTTNPIKVQYLLANPTTENISLTSNKCLVHGQTQSDTAILPDFRYSLPTSKYEIPELKANTYYTVKTNEESFNLNNYITTGYTQPVITESDSSSFKVKTDVEDTTVAIEDNKPAKEFKLEGQTFQNILPEPTSLVMSTNLENTSINDQLTSGVKMVDCIAPIAKLEGRTLVNIYNYQYNPLLLSEETDWYENLVAEKGKISFDVVSMPISWKYINLGYLNYEMLKPNTKYLIIFKNSKNLLKASFIRGDGTEPIIQESVAIENNRAIVTTNSEFAINSQILYISINPIVGEKVSLENPMIIEYQEGMENWDIPYFEGMKSVEAPSVKTVGKNLFDGQIELGGYTGTTGDKYNAADRVRSINKTFLKAGTYYLSSENATMVAFELFNLDGTFRQEHANTSGGGNKLKIVLEEDSYTHITIITPDLLNAKIQIEENNISNTSYEPYKENTISTPEDFVLRGVNDTKDSLDLNTGKIIRRIGEVVLDGSDDETWVLYPRDNYSEWTTYQWRYSLPESFPASGFAYTGQNLKSTCDKLNWGIIGEGIEEDYEHYRSNGPDANGKSLYIYIWLNQSKATNTDELKTYLATNPIKIQYALYTPTTETVTMTATSNWKEVTLNSTANLATGTNYGNFNIFNNLTNAVCYGIPFKYKDCGLISDNLNYYRFDGEQFSNLPLEGISDGGGYVQLFIRFNNDKLSTYDLDGIKSYLSANNLKFRYLNNTVEACIDPRLLLFPNGHIMSSSNTILPTITYQSKTNNSYIMNLMAPNTQYTMNLYEKAGATTFSIDGTSITMGSGNIFTFTSPNTLTNKFLIMNTVTRQLPLTMILKGDMTTKEIPYFKGIRSSFEGNSNIEIKTTGKNLCNGIWYHGYSDNGGGGDISDISNGTKLGYAHRTDYIEIKPNKKYFVHLNNLNINSNITYNGNVIYYNLFDKNYNKISPSTKSVWNLSKTDYIMSTNSNVKYLVCHLWNPNSFRISTEKLIVEEAESYNFYEPYKSHTTTLNIANPLRSLPNGVCDTVEFNGDGTVTYTQRVGKFVLNGTEGWNSSTYSYTDIIEFIYYNNTYDGTLTINDRFRNGGDNVERFVGLDNGSFYLRINKNRLDSLDENGIKKYLQNNPITVYCAYKTPNIIPLSISELPHLFKNGHIFTNTDTPAKITYKPYTLRTKKVSSGSPLTTNVFYSKDPNITVIEGSVENYKLPQFDGLLSANLKGVNNCSLSEVYTLRSLPDGTRDTFNALTGVITKNITEIVMVGGTTGNRKASGISSSHPDNGITFWVNNLNVDSNRGSTDRYVLSDYGLDSAFISTTTGAVIDRLTISTGTDTNGTLRFAVPNSMGITTAEAFNEWLTEHPITVLCKANDVSYISISDILKPQASKNGTIYLDTTDNSINPVFKYRMPTTNYYQLDMKDNTTYTVQAQGSYTLNGQTTAVSGSTTINSNTNIIDL